jgi:hypothetical protein
MIWASLVIEGNMTPDLEYAILTFLSRHPRSWFTTLDLYRDIKDLPISEAQLRRGMADLDTAGKVTRKRELYIHHDHPRNRWRYQIHEAVRIEDDPKPVEAPPFSPQDKQDTENGKRYGIHGPTYRFIVNKPCGICGEIEEPRRFIKQL